MPRKAKEKTDEIEKKDIKKNVVKKSASTSKKSDGSKKKTESTKPVSETKKDTKKNTSTEKTKAVKKAAKKSALAKNIESIDDKTETKKKNVSKSTAKSTVKKSTDKSTAKSAVKKSTSKSTTKSTVKKSTSKSTAKNTEKKSTTKSATKSTAKKSTDKSPARKSKKTIQILEYYDLPYKYGNTIVRLLAQTPKTLFVYWEVSDSDIDNFKKIYGDDFYTKTKPLLIVHNLTLNKIYEVEINDFANCWYLNTDDSDCKFDIQLARKFIKNTQTDNNYNDTNYTEYLYVAQSNNLQSPNDHILFEKLKEFIIFRDVSTNKRIKKNIKSFKFLKDIYKFYKDMYDEDILNNPSSQFNF